MSSELISKRTRNEFREFLVGWILREIEMEFEAAYIDYDPQYEPQVGGARRSFVEQHYHTLDFSSPDDIRRLVIAYESILNESIRGLSIEEAEQKIGKLVACLGKDGYKYQWDDGKIVPTSLAARKVFDIPSVGNSISQSTRRNIFDAIKLSKAQWSGVMEETEFLSRLYDLQSLPSYDGKFDNAKGDIWQHRENNPYDWPDDWVLRIRDLTC